MRADDMRPGQTAEHHDFRGDIYRFPVSEQNLKADDVDLALQNARHGRDRCRPYSLCPLPMQSSCMLHWAACAAVVRTRMLCLPACRWGMASF